MFNINELKAFRLKTAKSYKDAKAPATGLSWKTAGDTYSMYVDNKTPFALIPDEDMFVLDFDGEEASKYAVKYIKQKGIKTFMYKTNNGLHLWFRHNDFTRTLVSKGLLKNCSKHISANGIEADVRLGGKGYVAIRLRYNGQITDRSETFAHTDTLMEAPIEILPLFNNTKGNFTPPVLLEKGARNDELARFYGGLRALWFAEDLPKEYWSDYLGRGMRSLNALYEQPSSDLLTVKLPYYSKYPDKNEQIRITEKNIEFKKRMIDENQAKWHQAKDFYISKWKTKKDNKIPVYGIKQLGDETIMLKYTGGHTPGWVPQNLDATVDAFIRYFDYQVWGGVGIIRRNGKYNKILGAERTGILYSSVIKELKGLSTPTKAIKDIVSRIELLQVNNLWNTEYSIHFQNGVYYWKTDKFVPRTTGMKYSPYSLPCNYNPDAKIPTHWTNTLKSVSGNDADIAKQIKECFAVSMLDTVVVKKFFMVYGPTHTGKSFVFDKILSSLLGEENISHEPLTHLTSKYAGSTLAGKLLNFVDDENSTVNNDKLDKLRSISAGASIQIEAKFKDPISTKVGASLVFGVNNLPQMKDSSGAMDNRLQIIPFMQSFKDKPQLEQIKAREASNEMLADEEQVSGIINDVIATLKDLYINNFELTTSAVTSELLEEQENNNQFVLGWLRAEYDNNIGPNAENGFISTTELYSAYVMHTKIKGVHALSEHRFKSDLSTAIRIFKQETGIDIERCKNAKMASEYIWGKASNSPTWTREVNRKARIRGYNIPEWKDPDKETDESLDFLKEFI